MTKQLKFLIAAFVLILLFLYAVSDILLPFVLGILCAYSLDPLARKLKKMGVSRSISTVILTMIFFTIVITAAVTLLPVLLDQIHGFFQQLPAFYKQFDEKLVPLIAAELNKINPEIANKLHFESADISKKLSAIIASSIDGVFKSGMSVINFLSLVLITPIVTFYLLRDWNKFVKKIDTLLPRKYAPVIRQQFREIDDTIASFIHGQLNACILMSLVYAICLSIAGLDFGIIIGVVTGLLIFIPFVGFIFGAGTGILVAYFQYPESPEQVLLIAATFFAIHLAEANIISPKIVGGKIGIHPAWLIFGMLAGGSLLGFVGVIISVPATAVIGVLVKFAISEYSHSEFYVDPDAKPKPKKLKKNAKNV